MDIIERLKIYAKTYQEEPYGREVEGTVELLEEAAEYIEMICKKGDRDNVYKRCICTYGENPQIDMAIEEMSELIKALLKWRRNKNGISVRDSIIDELADVRIMCRQMEILFDAKDEVERKIDFKVNRQRERLDKREEEKDAKKR